MTCRFSAVRDPGLPEGSEASHNRLMCDGTGNMLACQLCPDSLTHWKLTDSGPSADPWGGPAQSTLTEPDHVDVSHLIDCKRDGWYWGGQSKCTLCLQPCRLYSPRDIACHKVCAEEYRLGRRDFLSGRN